MTPENKSFTVSHPRGGNYETFPPSDETSNETLMKPTSLKALAARVLSRNQQGNFNETCTETPCNFSPENHPQKFHSFTGENHDEATRPLPAWCRTNCPGLEAIDLPNEGEVVGCVNPFTGAWRRLEWMSTCPAMEKKPTRPALPDWCRPGCDNLHLLDGVACCCSEQDDHHWSRRRISSLNGCPRPRIEVRP